MRNPTHSYPWLCSVIGFFLAIDALASNQSEQRVEDVLDRSNGNWEKVGDVEGGDCVYLRGYNANHFGINDAGLLVAPVKGALGAPCIHIFRVDKDGHTSAERGEPLQHGDQILLKGWDGYFLGEVDGGLQAWAPTANKSVFFKIHKEEAFKHKSMSFLEGSRWDEEDQTKDTLSAGDGFFLAAPSGKFVMVRGHDAIVNGRAPGRQHRFVFENALFGALHSVTGPDGVYMISVIKDGYAAQAVPSLSALRDVKVFPTLLRATEPWEAEDGALTLTCPLEEDEGVEEWCLEMGREGQAGCTTGLEQAVADSHRRALLLAKRRSIQAPNWTAILEDDVVPVDSEQFASAFMKAWAKLPEQARFVRLSWCTFEGDLGEIQDEEVTTVGPLRLVSKRWYTDADEGVHYHTGGCTGGYLVHRDIVEEVLATFPCCSAFDTCLDRQLFHQAPLEDAGASTDDQDPNEKLNAEMRRWRGSEILVDLDHVNSRKMSAGLTNFNQSGILMQDHRNRQA